MSRGVERNHSNLSKAGLQGLCVAKPLEENSKRLNALDLRIAGLQGSVV